MFISTLYFRTDVRILFIILFIIRYKPAISTWYHKNVCKIIGEKKRDKNSYKYINILKHFVALENR